MTNTIALPIKPPLFPADGVRFFYYKMSGRWQESIFFEWCRLDVERLLSSRQCAESDGPDAWAWTSPLAFPEAWPPDELQDWLWYEQVQLSMFP